MAYTLNIYESLLVCDCPPGALSASLQDCHETHPPARVGEMLASAVALVGEAARVFHEGWLAGLRGPRPEPSPDAVVAHGDVW